MCRNKQDCVRKTKKRRFTFIWIRLCTVELEPNANTFCRTGDIFGLRLPPLVLLLTHSLISSAASWGLLKSSLLLSQWKLALLVATKASSMGKPSLANMPLAISTTSWLDLAVKVLCSFLSILYGPVRTEAAAVWDLAFCLTLKDTTCTSKPPPYRFSCTEERRAPASSSLRGPPAAACPGWRPRRGVRAPRSPRAWSWQLAERPVCRGQSPVRHR